MNNLSFWTGGDPLLDVLAVVDIFGSGGFLAAVDLLSGGLVTAFHDLGAFENVVRIAVRDIRASANGAAGLYYDSFRFDMDDPSEVPLPGGLALLLTGLAGLGFASRAKKRN
ncbi:MAG: hypothetical protein AB7P23_02535 [Amphiplicatus sp.]